MPIEFKEYPSTNQYRHAIRSACHKGRAPTLTFRGTVKLHGTNCAIIFDKGEVGFQSRNNLITPDSDHFDFATTMSEMVKLKDSDRLVHLVSLINQKGYHMETAGEPVYIYGEWCGGKISKKVALNKLDRMFVIFRIQIGDKILDQKEMAHVSMHQHRIFNIMDFPNYELDIDFTRPEEAQNVLSDMTQKVEDECPAGKYFDVSGTGEGIVWRCVTEGYDHIMFKVKGEKHSKSKVKTLAPVDIEKVNNINEFLDNVVQEWRLEQGIEFLRESHKPMDESSTGDFIRWMFNDIVKEESDTMKASGINKKEIGKPLSLRSRNWFFEYLTQSAIDDGLSDEAMEHSNEEVEEQEKEVA